MTTMELYKKILTDRMNHYRALWKKDSRPQDLYAYQAYEEALIMFEYAENGDYNCLTQFDYLGEDNE